MLENAFNLFLIVVGFGLVIVVHELGHFAAAKWAGIRVHAFAVGFGQAVCSYRKGMGFRIGSSEPEYVRQLKDLGLPPDRGDLPGVSSTEYRFNWIPFGGYVKMLGQEDMDPAARSEAPDAYNNASVGKRLVVISAGVVMNVILAAILFMVVFGVGMMTPPSIVGSLDPDGPARRAGVRTGDVITQINGREVDQFAELSMVAAMTKRGTPLELAVRRPGVPEPLELTIKPERDEQTKLMQLGIFPSRGTELLKPLTQKDRELLRERYVEHGFGDLPFGSTLVSVNGAEIEPVRVTDYATVSTPSALRDAIESSGGLPVSVAFEAPDNGGVHAVTIDPLPAYQLARVRLDSETTQTTRHLLGLTPAMAVGSLTPAAEKAGLRVGDLFARIGGAAWPSVTQGVAEIRAMRGRSIPLTVLRDGEMVDIEAPVDAQGRIGFGPSEAFDRPYVTLLSEDADGKPLSSSSFSPGAIPGMRLVALDGAPVDDFASLRSALRASTSGARASGTGAEVELTVGFGAGDATQETLAWSLTATDVHALHELGWNAEPHLAWFGSAGYVRKAQNPIEAVTMGVGATRDMLVRTYITFLRLFDGTVKVEHLRGPVGIADVGVQFASEGFIHVLFFLALISANLAVINFLPIPFVDGGHVVFLLIEGATKKPVPIVVQNLATLAGLGLIGVVFLIVTFNDIARLLG